MGLKGPGLLLLSALFTTALAAADETHIVELAIQADKAGKHEKALKLYKKAAEAGDYRAMTAVGLKYYAGEGTKQDYCAAYEWFNRAWERDADALNNIGVMFRDGQCVKQNRKIAYLTFLIIHMEGLGAEQTQMRANRNMRREVAEIPQNDVHEALCYTFSYYRQAIGSRGEDMNVPPEHMPSENNPRFKETAWWLPHERERLNFECPEPWKMNRGLHAPQ
jgi:tetratricopeptide (TPR) repeat protein